MNKPIDSRKNTINDVAREAGVGVGTVSRYLHPAQRRGIKHEDIKLKIEAAIRKLDYTPNPNRSKRRRVSHKQWTLGLLTSLSKDIFNSRYHTAILSGVFDRIAKTPHDLKFILLREKHYERLEEILYEHEVDGLMILTWRIHPSVIKLVEESDGKLPLVIFNDYDPKVKVNILYTDVKEGVKQGVFYLIEKGYRKIGMLTGPTHMVFRDGDTELEIPSIDVKEKTEGFMEALKEKRIPLIKTYIKRCVSYNYGDGYHEMKVWIQKGNLPEAIVCANDEIALGAMRALKESRIWCPQGMALVGFDDIEKARIVSPSLTTVRQPLYQMGHDAIEILVEKIEAPGKELVQRKYMPELVVRQTA